MTCLSDTTDRHPNYSTARCNCGYHSYHSPISQLRVVQKAQTLDSWPLPACDGSLHKQHGTFHAHGLTHVWPFMLPLPTGGYRNSWQSEVLADFQPFRLITANLISKFVAITGSEGNSL